jgi:hypothetical protein
MKLSSLATRNFRSRTFRSPRRSCGDLRRALYLHLLCLRTCRRSMLFHRRVKKAITSPTQQHMSHMRTTCFTVARSRLINSRLRRSDAIANRSESSRDNPPRRMRSVTCAAASILLILFSVTSPLHFPYCATMIILIVDHPPCITIYSHLFRDAKM